MENPKEDNLKNGSGQYKNHNLHGMYGKKHTNETKLKMRIKRLGTKVSEEGRLNMSKAFTGRKHTQESIQKMKDVALKNGSGLWMKGKKLSEKTKSKMREWHIKNPNTKFKETGIELKIEAELIKRGINYQKQVPLCNIAIVDFYLPEYRIVIQADGCYWHGCPIHYPTYHNSKQRDLNQDKVLTFNGFNLYRFWEHEINESIEACLSKILWIK